MNKFLLLLFLLSIGMIACSESEKEGDHSNVEMTERDERNRENRDHKRLMREDWSVEEVIDVWINNLNERLSLSEQAREDIRRVYQNAYLEHGDSLDDQLSREEVQKIGRELVRSTESEIKEIMTPDQFNFYKGHLINR